MQMTLTFESPDRDGWSIRVSLEFRYETCELRRRNESASDREAQR